MKKESKSDARDLILATMKRLVPGTIDIGKCDNIEDCMENRIDPCIDIKKLCIFCRDNAKIIGGIRFIHGLDVATGKNSIIIYRYCQEGNYIKGFEGNGIDEIMKKIEKDEVIKDMSDRTKFVENEQKEAENSKIIDDFKKYIDQSDKDGCVLVTRKNNNGEYEDLDKKLIEIAKEKEEKTGKKIKIVDESELDRKIYILGIGSDELIKKLILEAETINDSEVDRVNIFVMPTIKNKKFRDGKEEFSGILAINSIDDDILDKDEIKDRWKKYFTEKYKELQFIGKEIMKNDKEMIKK